MTTADGSLQVSTRLMQNYRSQSFLQVNTEVSLIAAPDGGVEGFFIGPDKEIYHLRRDPESATGWRQDKIGARGDQIAAGVTKDGERVVFAILDKAVFYIEEAGGGWTAPQTLKWAGGGEAVRVVARNLGGELYFGAAWKFNDLPRYNIIPSQWPAEPYDSFMVASDNLNFDFISDPEKGAAMTVTYQPRLEYATISAFQPENLYSDEDGGGPMNVTFWRPDGGILDVFGDWAEPNHDAKPSGTMLGCNISVSLFEPGGPSFPYPCASPTGYRLLYADHGTGAKENGSVWWPVAPEGYTALGGVAMRGYDPPSNDLVQCIRSDWVVEARVGDLIWNNKGCHGHPGPISVYAVDAPLGAGIRTGCFYAQADYDAPNQKVYVPSSAGPNWAVYNLWMSDPYGMTVSKIKIDESHRFDVYDLAVASSPDVAPLYAILQSDRHLYVLVNGSDGESEWQQLDARYHLKAVQAVFDRGEPSLLAIGVDNRLYHCRRINGAWTELVPIADGVASVSVGAGAGGAAEALTVGNDGDVRIATRDADSSDWNVRPIGLPQANEMKELKTYTVEITVLDAAGLPLPGADVRVWSSSGVDLFINGKYYFADSIVEARCQSNKIGRVTIYTETGALAAATLTVTASNLAEGASYIIEPNAHEQARLADVQPADLLSAVDAEGNHLLQGTESERQSNADALAPTIRKCMQLTQDSARRAAFTRGVRAQAAPLGAGNPGANGRAALQGVAAAANRIDGSSVEEQHWHLDLRGGKAAYRDLDRAGAAAIVSAKRASLFGLNVSWGDVWSAIKTGVSDLVDLTVSTVSGGIHAALTLMVDGAARLFEATIHLVEQAFDIVQGVFDAVKVAFEELFEWLGFLFDWGDILRSQEVIVHTVSQLFPFLKAELSALKRFVDGSIKGLEAQVQEAVQDIIAKLNGVDVTVGGFLQQKVAPERAKLPEAHPGANLFFTGFTNQDDVPSPSVASASASDVEPVVTTFLEQAAKAASDFEATSAFREAASKFEQMFKCSSVDDALKLGVAGLLQVLAGIAVTALEALRVIIDALLDACVAVLDRLQAMLTAPWKIPFLSDLYAFVTEDEEHPEGRELCALELVGMFAALPGTVLYKVTTGRAPFPTDDVVKEVTGSITVDMLCQAAGLGGSSAGASRRPGDDELPKWKQIVGPIFSFYGALTATTYGFMEAFLDALPPSDAAPMWQSITVLGLDLVFQAFSMPVWEKASMAPGILSADGVESSIWWYQNLGLGMDSILLIAQGVLARNWGDQGCILDSSYGIIHMYLFWCHFVLTDLDVNWELGANVCSTIPEMIKFLRHTKMVASTETISLPILALFDVAGGLATTVFSFIDQVEDAESVRRPLAPMSGGVALAASA